MVDARTAAPDQLPALLAETAAEVGQVGEPGPMEQRVVAQRGGRAHPHAVAEDAFEEVGGRDLAHFDQRDTGTRGRILGFRPFATGRGVEHAALALGMERSEHGEDDFALLHGHYVASREGAAVTVAVNLENDGQVATPGPQEVAVQRVRQAVLLNGRGGGQQALGRHLPAVERRARAVIGVTGAEQVAVDPFERQELGQVVGDLELHAHVVSAFQARTQSAHVSIRRQNSSLVPAKLCMCAILGHTNTSTLGADR